MYGAVSLEDRHQLGAPPARARHSVVTRRGFRNLEAKVSAPHCSLFAGPSKFSKRRVGAGEGKGILPGVLRTPQAKRGGKMVRRGRSGCTDFTSLESRRVGAGSGHGQRVSISKRPRLHKN